MPRPILFLALVLSLSACVSSPGREPTASDFSRTPEARGVSGVNPTATAILTRLALEDDD